MNTTFYRMLAVLFVCFSVIDSQLNNVNPTITQTVFYVAPNGSDNGPGTLTEPFRSLEKARDVIRAIAATMPNDITVYLREGTYYLAAPFVLTPEDSGQNGYNVVYRAYPGEKVFLSGGVVIDNWILYDSANQIYRAPFSSSFKSRQFYVNEVRAIRARSETTLTGFTKTASGYVTTDAGMAAWKNVSDIEFVFRRYWVNQRCGVVSIVGQQITMKQPCFANAQLHSTTAIRVPAWIENAYELLDSEGEWYFDRAAGYVYYKPRAGENILTATAVIPTLEALVVGNGTATDPLHNIQFVGITFTHATWLGPDSNDGFAEIQANYTLTGHDADLADPFSWTRMPAALDFTYAQSIRFERNIFAHLGAAGLAFGTGSQNNEAIGNVFYDISGTAIQIGGIAPVDRLGNYAAARNNRIANNSISHVGVEYNGAPGIYVGFADSTTILHNELSFLPYTGISLGWGWGQGEQYTGPVQYSPTVARFNRIQYNHIHHYMQVLQDGGGIYTLGRQVRSVISDNYIHDQSHEFGGIYLDLGTQGLNIIHNVVTAVPYWFNTGANSRDNVAQQNYSDTGAVLINARSQVLLSDNFTIGETGWPTEAQMIAEAAGLEPAYADLRSVSLGNDLAVDRTATASSALNVQTLAFRGNDDDKLTAWISNDNDHRPWWTVQLDGACFIGRIEVSGRLDVDDPTERRNFEIQASNVPDFSSFVVLGRVGSRGFPFKTTWTIEPSIAAAYHYVRAIKTVAEGFAIAELALRSTVENRYCNVAAFKEATASSIISGNFNAADGNDENSSTGWSPTGEDRRPWWQVDLGAAYPITTIELVLRQDIDQPPTRRNFEILASNVCDFSSYAVLGHQGDTILDHKASWVIHPDSSTSFRYIRVAKTSDEYFYFSELKAWQDSTVSPIYTGVTTLTSASESSCFGSIRRK